MKIQASSKSYIKHWILTSAPSCFCFLQFHLRISLQS